MCGLGFTFTDSRQEAWARVSNTDRASVEVNLKESDVHHRYTDKPVKSAKLVFTTVCHPNYQLTEEHMWLRSP